MKRKTWSGLVGHIQSALLHRFKSQADTAAHPRGDSAAQPVPLNILFSLLIFKATNHFTTGGQDDAKITDVKEHCVDLLHSVAEVAIYIM